MVVIKRKIRRGFQGVVFNILHLIIFPTKFEMRKIIKKKYLNIKVIIKVKFINKDRYLRSLGNLFFPNSFALQKKSIGN